MHFSRAKSKVCEPPGAGAPVDKGIRGIMEPSTTVARAAAGAGRAVPTPAEMPAPVPDPGPFDGAKMWVIDKSTALAGGALTVTVFGNFFDFENLEP